MRLGELLIEDGQLTQSSLEEAIESQVVNGGRLGTNLFELGLVSEEVLGSALGKQHGAAVTWGELAPQPKALALVDPAWADRHDVLPLQLEPTRVTVAVLDPGVRLPLDELGFRTGLRVVPLVVPELRMRQALRLHCGAFRALRTVDVRAMPRPTVVPAGSPAVDLMTDEEFLELYAGLTGSTPPPPRVGGVAIGGGPGPQVLGWESRSWEGRVAVPLSTLEAEAIGSSAAAPQLSFEEAQRHLAACSDREDIARIVLRFAISRWKRAVLFSVQGELLAGWHGLGQGVLERNVRRMVVSTRTKGPLALVRDSRSHFAGPVPEDAATKGFYRLLGGGLPATAVILPVLARGRVVHLLYVDNGPSQTTHPELGELLILLQSVGRSYEALVRRHMT